MSLHIVAPCPQKPSSVHCFHWQAVNEPTTNDTQLNNLEDACRELQQILASHHQFMFPHQGMQSKSDSQLIARTANPLPHDSSFIPLHQAVAELQVSDDDISPQALAKPLSGW
ncbi:uncharacterized protein BYT42DRAFT_30803 [Radiomyces spectabilis]|uniref:uncharacterized protein n=1 Tax=Radiomyces spectabilis TaxID=64574 RepID=UPI0022207F3B|nr:uncharacterized protein BYT42DRAFT_30803 [Radiomyces spectabilis]KAI8394102.1 hypothetical protein BYT42DRAFT_30803 [Radiomyces spectabilis]